MKCGITVDFHSHILPGADHGSDSVKTSRGQLDLIAAAGIRRVVATPHFYPMSDNLDTFLSRRSETAGKLKAVMRPGDPSVHLGAEVLICEGIERMEGLDKLAVYGTKSILLEMPMSKWSDALFETVETIANSGFSVVMAHIDRYDPKYVDELMKIDVSAQLNPGTFFSRKGRKFAAKWLNSGKVAAIGSDLHGAAERDYREFTEAAEALGEFAPAVERSMNRLLEGAKTISYHEPVQK